MAVDVVCVNYKTDDLLIKFIDSYQKTKFPGCTLTVVDVQSPFKREETDTMAKRLGGQFLAFRDNVGYGRACNAGADQGSNDVILLANADTLLTADGLEACYEALISHPKWAVLGPRQIDADGRITAGGIFGTDRFPQQRGWAEPDHGQYSDVRTDALTVSGSLYFIKRSVWKELTECAVFQEYQPDSIGAFLQTQHYFEETFCSYHARSHGYKCVFYGPVQMVHLFHKASPHGGWADQQFGASQAMMRQACAQHGIICE